MDRFLAQPPVVPSSRRVGHCRVAKEGEGERDRGGEKEKKRKRTAKFHVVVTRSLLDEGAFLRRPVLEVEVMSALGFIPHLGV